MSQFTTPIEALSVLGLDQNATKDDIRGAYRRMAALYHPDSRPDDESHSPEAFLVIREAYDYLIDAYDRALEAYINSQKEPVYNAAPRVLGNEDAIIRQEEMRDMARQRLAHQKRLEKERILNKRKKEEEMAANLRRAREEEQLREHALRAADITADIIRAIVLNGGVDALDKPF